MKKNNDIEFLKTLTKTGEDRSIQDIYKDDPGNPDAVKSAKDYSNYFKTYKYLTPEEQHDQDLFDARKIIYDED